MEIDTRKEAYLTAFGSFMAFAEPISISLIQASILKDDLMKYAREKAQIDSVSRPPAGSAGSTPDRGRGYKATYAAAKAAYTAYADLVATPSTPISSTDANPRQSMDMCKVLCGGI